MADQAEIVTMVIILLATIGLILLNKLKGNNKLRLRFSKAVDDLEDIIEEETGLDLEISEVVNDAIEEVANKAEDVLDDIKEDGVLDESLSDVLKELGDTLESIAKAIKAMTVTQLKDLLKKQGLPITGKKNDLLERLLALLK